MKPVVLARLAARLILSAAGLFPASSNGDAALAPQPAFLGTWPGYARGQAITIQVVGDYGYLATGYGGLAVLDIRDPRNPVRLGGCKIPGYAWGLHVAGDYAYVVGIGAGLQVIDIRNPAQPVNVGGITTTGTSHCVWATGQYAYVTDRDSGINVFDVRDPAHPRLAGGFYVGGQAEAITLADNFAYVAAGLAGLQILDVSNPTNLVPVGSWTNRFACCMSAQGVTVRSNRVYLAAASSGVFIIDTSDPTHPVLDSGLSTGPYASSVQLAGSYAYVAAGNGGGVQIWDLNHRDDPIATYETDRYYGEAHSLQVVVQPSVTYPGLGPHIYVAYGAAGVEVIEAIAPASVRVGKYESDGFAQQLSLSDGSVYLADDVAGLQILDVNNPVQPRRVGNYLTLSRAFGVDVTNHIAAVADYNESLSLVDVTNAGVARLIGKLASHGVSCPAFFGPSSLYFGAEDIGGMRRVDLPSVTSSFGLLLDGLVRNIRIFGRYFYVASDFAGVHIVNGNSAFPFVIRTVDTPGEANDVFVKGDFAYVADGSAGLQVIKVQNPSNAVVVAGFPTGGTAFGIQVQGDYAYVAAGRAGLQIVNIADPAHPAGAGSYTNLTDAYAVIVAGDKAYIADGENGLVILGLLSPVALTIEKSGSQIRLHVKGNPGIPFTIESIASLADTARWAGLFTTNAESMPFLFTDSNASPAQRFYRVRQP